MSRPETARPEYRLNIYLPRGDADRLKRIAESRKWYEITRIS